MGKFIEWLTSKFQQPLSLLFFLLGALLILLGLTTGLEIPFLKRLTPEGDYRVITLALGCVFLGAAVILDRVASRPATVVRGRQDVAVENDVVKRFSQLLQDISLSPTQKSILSVMAETVPAGGYKSESELRHVLRDRVERLRQSSDSELYYRLEQLYLLGFLTKRNISPERHIYSPSDDFRQFLLQGSGMKLN